MQLFKKVNFLLLVLLSLFLNGCGRSLENHRLKEWMGDSPEIRVLCSTAQIGDLVSEIGGGRVKTWVLIQGDLDPHSYELVKGDDEKLFRSDLIFYHGLNLEHGASLSSFFRTSSKSVSVGDEIARRYPEKILKRGSVVDPHLWMDISIWEKGIDPIVEGLSQKDPERADEYRARGSLLREKMMLAHQELKMKLSSLSLEKRYLLTSHDAFRYFTKGYLASENDGNWQDRFAAPEGLAPDGQLSAVDIQRMIDYVRKYKVSVLFPESNVSRDSIRKIAIAGREFGIDVRVCEEPLYGDSMSGQSYLEMMRKNGDVMLRNLK